MVYEPNLLSAIQRVDEIPGHLSLEEGLWLSCIAKGRIGLEIGSYKGRSSCFIGLTAKILFCCDAFCGQKKIRSDQNIVDFREVRSAWHANVLSHELIAQIELIESRSEEAFDVIREKCSGQLDFIFIDGGHDFESIRQDLKYTKLLVEGGVVAVHDYFYSYYPGVTMAVGQWVTNYRSEFKELKSVGSMIAFSKIS